MGLDRELFHGDVDPAYICDLCSQVLLNPVTAGCQHIFCQTCVHRKLKSRVSRAICPSCSAKLKPEMSETSLEFKLKLLDLKIFCNHKCGEIFILADLPDHAEVCPNAPVQYEFKDHGCKRTVKRCDLRKHLIECDFRFVECEACGYKTMYRDLFTHQSRVRCLEKKLKQQIIRERKTASKEINKHREKLFREQIRLDQHQRKSLLKHSKSFNSFTDKQFRKRTDSGSEFDYSPRQEVFLTKSALGHHENLTRTEEENENENENDKVQNVERNYKLATRTPHTSRSGFALQMCIQCDKRFRMDTNHQNACRWHIGPMVQVFGGTCFACGRLDYQPGCATGFHRL